MQDKKIVRMPVDSAIPLQVANQMKVGFPLMFAEMSEDLGRYAEVAEKATKISRNYPPSKYSNVLDICCGLGAYSEALSAIGHCVTAIDLSDEQIESCKSRGGSVKYIVRNMVDPPPGPFDLAINMYSSFGYMDSVQEDQRVLGNWYNVLRVGGVLLMELSDLERAKQSFGYPKSSIFRTNHGVTERLQIDWTSQIMTIEYKKQSGSLEIMTRLYTQDQLAEMLRLCGFRDISFFGALDLKAPKLAQDRLVVRCVK